MYKIIYLPTAEEVKLYTYYSSDWEERFRYSKDIFNTYEEAYDIIQDNRILFLSRNRAAIVGAYVYLDYKGFPGHSSLVPKHLLEIIEQNV